MVPAMTSAKPITHSVVVPVYCEAASLGELTDRIGATFVGMGRGDDFEVLFVDDGSVDSTPDVIRGLMREKPYVRSVTLRRNFGKSIALMAGFENSRGSIVVTLDGDLQDNPEDIPILLKKLDEGFDVVTGWRLARNDGFIRRFGSRLFNTTVARLTGLELHDFNCGFKAYRAAACATLRIYGQYHRYIPLQAHMLGFKVAEVRVENSERKHGLSKYRALRYEGLFDLFSLLFVHKYGLNPLHFFGTISLLLIFPSLFILAFLIGKHMLYWMGFSEEFMLLSRPLFSLSLNTLLLGAIIFFTGFVCDFVLHHHVRKNIGDIVDSCVAAVDGRIEHAEGPVGKTPPRA